MSTSASNAKPIQLTGPFDSFRDYLTALEARGRLLRIAEMDQDRFEPAGFAYRMIEEHGFYKAPAFLIERVKIKGRWIDGPVLGNAYPGWDSEALAFGVAAISSNQREMHRACFNLLKGLVDENGRWPAIEPVVVDAAQAPCKQVKLSGKDVDLLQFPWLQTNPGDAGPYINSASVFVEDPELGRNVATYRCQVKGSNKIGVNSEIGQHGWNLFMRAKKRGESTVPVAVVLGADPITFGVGTSKLTGLGEDELALAGGLRGKAVEMVPCETSSVLVPAQAEIVIEGEIPVSEMEPEGPYGEVYGYMGLQKPENFFMNVKAITHRTQPLIVNSFAGITKLTLSIPQNVSNFVNYKKQIPNLVQVYRPIETTGVMFLSIKKRFPGEGMTAGQLVAAGDLFAKVVIVLDEDVDVHDMTQVFHSLGTRWQPDPASLLIPQTRGMPLDPSQPKRWITSKIVIDATKQFPNEGGPAVWPEVSRVLLDDESPETFDLVDERWADYWKGWSN
jgi:UbiD family decarboxylase